MKKKMLLNVTPALHWELIIKFENVFPDVKRRNWFQSLQYASPDIPRDCLCTRQLRPFASQQYSRQCYNFGIPGLPTHKRQQQTAFNGIPNIREHSEHWRAFESIRYHLYHCAPLAFATQHSSWRQNTWYRNKQKNYDSIIWLTKLTNDTLSCTWRIVNSGQINFHDEVSPDFLKSVTPPQSKSKLHSDHIEKENVTQCYTSSALHWET